MSDSNRIFPQDLELPALPLTAQRLLPMLDQDDVDLRLLVAAIEQDPGLAARVVGVARSAYYGAQTGIHSVRDAVVRCLGTDMVWNLALGIALSNVFDSRNCPAFDLPRYWLGAIGSAELATSWARAMPKLQVEPDLAYLSGLLHNLGLLALIAWHPQATQRALRARLDDPQLPMAEALQRELGTDHHRVGGKLAEHWHLPPGTVQVMRHWSRAPQDGCEPLCQLVQMAVLATRATVAGVPIEQVIGAGAERLGVAADELLQAAVVTHARFDELQYLAKQLAARA